MVGPIAGGIFSSSQLMIVATTSVASLSVGQALGSLQGEARDNSLFVMVALIGALQILFGMLRLGRLTRFVSYSVMTGFIIGIAVLTILSQLPTITGYAPTRGGNSVTLTFNLLANLGEVNRLSLSLSALTLVLALTLPRTKLGQLGSLAAIIIPSALVALLHLDSVAVVKDIGEIPGGLPMPHLPSLSDISIEVLMGALAVAVIILVQGAGVGQSVPTRMGRRAASRATSSARAWPMSPRGFSGVCRSVAH